MSRIARIALVVLLAVAGRAQAADACRPLQVLPASTTVRFSPQEFELLPRLQVVAGKALMVTADPLAFAATPIGSGAQHSVPLPPQILGQGFLGSAGAALQFERINGRRAGAAPQPASGKIFVQAGNRRFILRVKDGVARGVDGLPLQLLPPVASESSFSVLRDGPPVTEAGPGRVQLASGTRLEWSAEVGTGGLKGHLLRAVRLEQSAPAESAAQLEIVKARRVLPSGAVRVKVTAPGFDFGSKVLAFCFSAPEGAAGERPETFAGLAARLVERSGDAAIYEVQLPEQLGESLAEAQASRWPALYRAAQLRVLGYDGADVALDTTQGFHVSNAWAAIAAGLATVLIAFVLGGVLARERNPTRILHHLARRADGAYSLSNVQILMWTVLVIFALCYVWAGSDQLLAISPGILVLLGISGGSSVLARHLDGSKVAPTGVTSQGKFADLFSDETGKFDLLRFQMLGFTVFTWLYSLVSVLRSQGLPEIPDNLYLLMGISNAAYIGGKVVDQGGADGTGAAGAAAQPADLSEAEQALSRSQIEGLQRALGVPETGQLDAATREAVTRYKRQQGITPANGRVNPLLLKKVRA